MEVTVEPGPGPGDPPNAVILGGRRRAVAAVLDRWPGSDHLYLKVRLDDGGLYLLRRDDASGRWALWLYRTGGSGAGPPLSGA